MADHGTQLSILYPLKESGKRQGLVKTDSGTESNKSRPLIEDKNVLQGSRKNGYCMWKFIMREYSSCHHELKTGRNSDCLCSFDSQDTVRGDFLE